MRTMVLLGLLLLANTGWASDKKGSFAPKGAGQITCRVFTAEHKKGSNAYLLFRGWLDGYITAINELTPDTFDITSWESTAFLASVADSHCSKHPDDQLLTVVMTIVKQLREHRVREQSPYVTAVAGSQKRVLYKFTLEKVQAELARRGGYAGPADGSFTDATRSALAAFQTKEKLPPTGLPDEQTLWRLLRPLPTK